MHAAEGYAGICEGEQRHDEVVDKRVQRVLEVLERGDDFVGRRFYLFQQVHLFAGENAGAFKPVVAARGKMADGFADNLNIVARIEHGTCRDTQRYCHTCNGGMDA